MTIIFQTYGGLCNQFFDINAGINFCIKHNLKFSFRYANFRNNDLISWYKVNFDNLFDTSFLEEFELYVDYKKLDLNKENTTNFEENKRCIELYTSNNILDKIKENKKEYLLLIQMWPIHNFSNDTICIYPKLLPSNKIMQVYNIIKNNLNPNNEPYNCLHYRYEHDFINHFKITNLPKLEELLENIEFKNKNNKTYVATTNIKNLINIKNYSNVIFKNDDRLRNLNFEERAFIDYLFGLESEEFFGHPNSSFSVLINNLKQTNNYY
jgi:hypothetical protein